jgi:hypothetical protein
MRLRVILLMVLLLALLPVAGPSRMSATGPPDDQSTTGPVPPPGVEVGGGQPASSAAVTISGVPAYTWHHGCGPTSAGMVLGYWDGNGYGDLVAGSAATQTAAVNDMIATEGPSSNYTDYCEPLDYAGVNPDPLPDLSELPEGDEHADECLADFINTSQSVHDNYYGWGWFSHLGPGVEDYVSWLDQGYTATSANHYWYTTLNWTLLQTEIDAGRPLIFSVDSNADGSADHFVTVVGYDSPGGVQKYACHNTWSTSVSWYGFQQMSSGVSYGVSKAITFQLDVSNHPPALGGVWPDSGSGHTGTVHYFHTGWSDLDYYYDLKQCYFHIGASPSLLGNVTLLYNRNKNKLWLLDDDGTWIGGFAPGALATAENDQAILHGALTDVGGYRYEMWVDWAIEFKPTFTGLKKLGLKAKDMSGAKAKGAWKGTFLIEPP